MITEIQTLIKSHDADHLLDAMNPTQLAQCYLYLLGEAGRFKVDSADVAYFVYDMDSQHTSGYYQLQSWAQLADLLYDQDGLAYDPLSDDDDEYDQARQISAIQHAWSQVFIDGKSYFYYF